MPCHDRFEGDERTGTRAMTPLFSVQSLADRISKLSPLDEMCVTEIDRWRSDVDCRAVDCIGPPDEWNSLFGGWLCPL